MGKGQPTPTGDVWLLLLGRIGLCLAAPCIAVVPQPRRALCPKCSTLGTRRTPGCRRCSRAASRSRQEPPSTHANHPANEAPPFPAQLCALSTRNRYLSGALRRRVLPFAVAAGCFRSPVLRRGTLPYRHPLSRGWNCLRPPNRRRPRRQRPARLAPALRDREEHLALGARRPWTTRGCSRLPRCGRRCRPGRRLRRCPRHPPRAARGEN